MKRLLILLLVSDSVFAAGPTGTNNVYIEQVGSSNIITIDQIGGTNNVGGTTLVSPISYTDNVITSFVPSPASTANYATITGNTNQVTIKHTGDDNWAQYNINGNNNTYSSEATGIGNQTLLTIGVAGTPSLVNIINEKISGDLNFIIQTVTKDNIQSTIDITGDNNQITTKLNSKLGINTTTVSGVSNSFINEQDDGALGHHLTQDILGDFNSVVTQQQGLNDSVIDISTTGSNNTITIHSTNAATVLNPRLAVAR